MKKVGTVLFGLGAVNQGLLRILMENRTNLSDQYGVEYNIKGVADSSGIATSEDGYAYGELLHLKKTGGKVSMLKGYLPVATGESLPDHIDAELLVESSPVDLETGGPGLALAARALRKGWSVVFANKAPLVVAYDELHNLAIKHGARIACSATVCGGLPVINVLKRDMVGASLKSFRGILNATTNHILNALERGGNMEDAIKEAQRVGAAEADPMHDVLGHDAANKLYIIMKSFTSFTGSIDDIQTKGIKQVTASQLADARLRGKAIKLIASAVPEGDRWKLVVEPTEISADSFLGQCEGWEMGVQFESDWYECISMKIHEEDPLATSAAVLRDMIHVSDSRFRVSN